MGASRPAEGTKVPAMERRWSTGTLVAFLVATVAMLLLFDAIPKALKWISYRHTFYTPRDNELITVEILLATVAAMLLLLILGRLRQRLLSFWEAPQKRLALVENLPPADLFKFESDIRAARVQIITTIAQIVGGAALLAGIYFTSANLNVAREGQITERFTRAIDQLGASYEVSGATAGTSSTKEGQGGSSATATMRAPNLELRLGGIYALARIANESASDYWAVMDILTVYIRENAPFTNAQLDSAEVNSKIQFRVDFQAILTLLGSRKTIRTDGALDLSKSNLANANLSDGDFSKTFFTATNLISASFVGARMMGAYFMSALILSADFTGANCQGADFTDADLRCTDFWGADLSSGVFTRAKLQCVDFQSSDMSNADLSGANLGGADLSRAKHLIQKQIDSANGDVATRLPAGWNRPTRWQTASPADCKRTSFSCDLNAQKHAP